MRPSPCGFRRGDRCEHGDSLGVSGCLGVVCESSGIGSLGAKQFQGGGVQRRSAQWLDLVGDRLAGQVVPEGDALLRLHQHPRRQACVESSGVLATQS